MRRTRTRSIALALAVTAVLASGANAASADTSVTVVTGSFDDGDTAGSASETVSVEAAGVGMQTGEFATDDMAGSAHETVAVVAAPVAVSVAAVVPTTAAIVFEAPVTDPDVLAALIRASGLTPPSPDVVNAGLVA